MNTKELTKTLLHEKNPFTDIIGQDKVKQAVKSALLSDRHLILVGSPGIGKTTLAKNIAGLLGKKTPFIRVQGSPDLTVEDLLGDIDPVKALKYGPLSIEAFTKGKIFKANNGILFFDELNRCPEKVQNALLQVLEEKKATIGSYDVDFDIDFIFIGTMNPEDSSTEKLSDVLLDRFDLVYMHYPESNNIEKEISGDKEYAILFAYARGERAIDEFRKGLSGGTENTLIGSGVLGSVAGTTVAVILIATTPVGWVAAGVAGFVTFVSVVTHGIIDFTSTAKPEYLAMTLFIDFTPEQLASVGCNLIK